MKIQYEKGDRVITNAHLCCFYEGTEVEVAEVDLEEYPNGTPYKITNGLVTEWVDENDIKPAHLPIPFPSEMNEVEVTEYRDKMIKADTQTGLDFLANHPDGYFLPKEIINEANLKFITPNTLEKMIEEEGRYPVENHYGYSWQQGWSIQSRKEELTKTYVGDSNGKIIKRTKTIHYYNMIKRGEN